MYSYLMKNTFCLIWAVLLSLFESVAGAPALTNHDPHVDWPAFLKRHDMAFGKLPRNWTEAPHFGNAMVGSMLYQEGNGLKLQIFRADVHDHRDSTWGWTAYSRPRMEIGHFLLHTTGKLTACNWRKDLWNAELTGTVTTDKGEIRIRHFTHAIDMAIITELTPSAAEKDFRWTWHPAEARTTRPGYPNDEAGRDAFAKRYGEHYRQTLKFPWKPNPPGRLEQHGPVFLWIQNLLAGGQYATAWGERTEGDTRIHIATIANSHLGSDAAKTARGDITRFSKADLTEWSKLHRNWWHNYYPRSFISLPDKSLEALYWHTIYRFGCTSRTGRGMVDTAGLWFQGKSWPYFTTDWNIQAAHWPVYTANRLEQGRELVDRLHRHQQTLIDNVRPVEWQEDSAFLALAVASDLRGSRDEDRRYYHLLGNLPWTLHNAWWHYRHSMDDAMLRETIHPLLRRAINLYLHMLIEEPDGTLRLPPTFSPETDVVADCNFDLALLKWGCHILLQSSARLGIDDPLIPRWREVIRRLPEFPVDDDGFRLGSDRTSPENHQHLSHLLMIYPLHLVNIDQPGAADVLKRSFQRALTTVGPGQRQAMVQSHAGPIGAAIGDGDGALESLRLLQADLYPNGLWYESPCIESSLGAATIIQDMLLQSWSDPTRETPGPIRVFPALPTSWQDLEFHKLRAEGAFLISAKRSAGKTEWVRIHSLAGEPCLVQPAIDGPIRIEGDADANITTISPGIYQIDLGKNREVLLVPDS
jgi:hypothetical protein